MNNKGFTLVELLAVIVILLGISLVVLSSVTSSLEKRENNEKNNQEELAINAAKIYFSLNNVTSVEIRTLIDDDTNKRAYLDKTKIDKLCVYDVIILSTSGDTAEYIYQKEVDETKCPSKG